jgi:hypothetical protein
VPPPPPPPPPPAVAQGFTLGGYRKKPSQSSMTLPTPSQTS